MNATRGGAKPFMMTGSTAVPITVGNQRKFGIYELSATRDTLARRVELPIWLSELWSMKRGSILRTVMLNRRAPAGQHDSRGHIFLNPPARMFGGPAVGIDTEPAGLFAQEMEIRTVRFYVYAAGYRLAGVWAIDRDHFIRRGLLVQTKPCFMPQVMVALSELTEIGSEQALAVGDKVTPSKVSQS
jgi:hypothetical protein